MYKTKMASDYFNIKGLETKTGLVSYDWNLAIIKELIDNALDAIENGNDKQIEIIQSNNGLEIFDNGIGISIENVMKIYDFEYYISKNRHIITPSRGKQGNGLKSIIGMCYVNGYELLWHTSNGKIIKAVFDADQIMDNDLEVEFLEIGTTTKTGVEIKRFYLLNNANFTAIMHQYSVCNPDTTFNITYFGEGLNYKAKMEAINRTQETSLSFYTYTDFKRLINVQEPNMTYKSFLESYFGTRVKNSSQIKSKISDLDLFNEVKEDFEMMKSTLKNKYLTILKKHLLGFDNSFEVSINPDSSLNDKSSFPCLVEYNVRKIDKKRDNTIINCYVNNSITYNDGGSLKFRYNQYKISNTKTVVNASDLNSLLSGFSNYIFDIHIIAPYLKFKDYGKTEIDISDFIETLVENLRKSLNKEHKKYSDSATKKPTQKFLAEKYMTQAFLMASSDCKYAITARQMYYKLRELAGREHSNWESDSTYSTFTQEWLTSWLNDNEQYESKVNFSDRGNFYVNGSQNGLGSANVRKFIDEIESKPDKFRLYGGIRNDLYITEDFNIKYKYDKALYIEKTGFDAVFKAEGLDEKYNLLIVSGQGFASREARRLLYNLQLQGLKLYCLHDLDVSGVSIYNSMCQANDKFKFNLDMINLGISPEDVEKYGIEPEIVNKLDCSVLTTLDDVNREFFDKGNHSQRVELNAFSTEQLLNIIDSKLNYSNLPKVNLSETLSFDQESIREVAFMRAIKSKYASQLESIVLPQYDLSEYNGKYTMADAKVIIPKIEEQMINQYKQEISKMLSM